MTAVDRETIERVLAEKRRRRSSSHGYQDRPRLAFVVHSFNRVANLDCDDPERGGRGAV